MTDERLAAAEAAARRMRGLRVREDGRFGCALGATNPDGTAGGPLFGRVGPPDGGDDGDDLTLLVEAAAELAAEVRRLRAAGG